MRIVAQAAPLDLDDGFVDLPRELYADDPHWIPEEEAVVRRAFTRSNPWFARGRAAALHVPGRARLAVFRTPACIVNGRRSAFFGYFESDGDPAPVAALLHEAREWARAAGAEALYGPVNFDTLGQYRLRLAAEPGGLPFPGEPYNRAGYAALLEAAGLAVVRQYATQVSAGPATATEQQRAALRALTEAGYTFDPLDGDGWMRLLPELHAMLDEIFGDAFAYVRAPYEEFAAGTGATVARRLCPHTSLAVRGPDGGLVGLLVCYPHYGPLAVQGTPLGRVPASELAFHLHQPRLAAAGERTAIAKTLGVVPTHRRMGVMGAIGAAVADRGRAHYDRWLAGLIRADNHSRRFFELHTRHERAYALYGAVLHDSPDPGAGHADH